MHRTFAALGVTPEAVEAGGVSCTTPDGREWRVTITSAENSNRPVKSSPPPTPVAINAPLPAERADAAWTTPSPSAVERSLPPPLPVTAIHRYASGGRGGTGGDPDPVDLLQSGGREKIAARNGNLLHAVFAGMAPARACALHGFSADATRVADCEAAYRDFCSHPLIRESTCQQCEVKFVHRFGGDVQVRGGAIDGSCADRTDGMW